MTWIAGTPEALAWKRNHMNLLHGLEPIQPKCCKCDALGYFTDANGVPWCETHLLEDLNAAEGFNSSDN